MTDGWTHRVLLAIAGVIAIGVGSAILVAPIAFHATHGIALGADPTLLSEVRAPGGALLALGVLIVLGTFTRSLTAMSTVVAATVYLAYGMARAVSLAIDGSPDPGIVAAMSIEIVLGVVVAASGVRARKRPAPARRPQGGECPPTFPGGGTAARGRDVQLSPRKTLLS